MALVGVAVLAVHGYVTQWLGEHLFDPALADAAPARMEVAYVREMAAESTPPAVAAPAAPPAPAVAVTAAATAVAVTPPPKAASAPEPAASRASRQPPLRPKPAASSAEAESEVVLSPDSTAGSSPEAADTSIASDTRNAAPDAPPEVSAAASLAASAAASAASNPTAAQSVAAVAPEAAKPRAAGAASAAAPVGSVFAAPTVLAQSPPAPASASAADGASGLPPFDWPASTRMSYRLTGKVRGEVHGDAQVEWIRVGRRYQVHLDVTVGLSVAPLMTRRMSSDGDITAEGLSPRRYDQDTKIGFGPRQRSTVLFEPAAVVLAGGQRRERLPGMQDTASQFIQLIYLFGTQPGLLRAGTALEVPLALPRNTSVWAYDVVGEDTVHSPIGPIAAFHLKPRRAVVKGGDLSAEMWFAPGYRYLPVRIRIEQDAQTFVDLVVARKPELGAP
ncbi:MAG: hypothetical protein AD742_14815 [Methylibium sp. NZG]|nr:MAG: hypothetical protein AD742_14815 [Methylibium sp. NZG]